MSELSDRHVFICSECGKSILEDDVFLEVMDEQYCLPCAKKKFKKAVRVDEEV